MYVDIRTKQKYINVLPRFLQLLNKYISFDTFN